MPFLRRRVVASDNDMRRHTFIETHKPQGQSPPQIESRPKSKPGSAPNPNPNSKSNDVEGSASALAKIKSTSRPSVENNTTPVVVTPPRTSTATYAHNYPDHDLPARISSSTAAGTSSFESMALSVSRSMSMTRPSQDPFERPESPPVQEQMPKHRRFSMLRFRNASDSQLSTRMRQQQIQDKPPPMPRPPAIITTAPTMIEEENATQPAQKKARVRLPMRLRRSGESIRGSDQPGPESDLSIKKVRSKKDRRKSFNFYPELSKPSQIDQQRPGLPDRKEAVTFHENRSRPQTSKSHSEASDPSRGEASALDLPSVLSRRSESMRPGRGWGASGEFGDLEESGERAGSGSVYGSGASHSGSTISFFRFPRRRLKQPEPLFALGHLPQKKDLNQKDSFHKDKSRQALPRTAASNPSLAPRESQDPPRPPSGQGRPSQDRHILMASPSQRLVGSPATALFRPSSRNSGQSSPTRNHMSLRGRSSTLSSLGKNSIDDFTLPGTTRTSSSTGRKSFGDLLGLSRLRQNTDGIARHGTMTPATPASIASKNNSLQLTRERECFVLPERNDEETPTKYLARIEEMVPRGAIASALSKANDPFSAAVLRSYMRTFSFFEEPMDMAIRKLLMEAELPKETQQIDRCLQAFANRYHECNPGIYTSPEQAYFIAFSLLILHTDVFNKNNKHKMQKPDYLKNTKDEGIFDDVLECFYDNINYTPFIHVEDDLDSKGERVSISKSKRKHVFPSSSHDPAKRSKDPLDPYMLIMENKLDNLRPPLRDQIPLEEHYSYMGTAKTLNLKELQKTFFKTGVLQIISQRSRPDAFMSEKTVTNPQEADPGVVDIKVTKVGIVWRKDQKKKKARSPWQEWGAILTGAQLYFFRNTTWVKSLVHQYDHHIKQGNDGVPLIFKPPLEQFKPDTLLSTDGAVALWDSSYKKHKNAFVYIRHGGLEEVLLAQSDEDRNDWLAKLNYAAAFRTSGVRMRNLVAGSPEGLTRRVIQRLSGDGNVSESAQVVQTPTQAGQATISRKKADNQLSEDIVAARREMIQQKIAEADEKLSAASNNLETQLRNARHLLILAPIQDKTREQVRGGAAKIIAQLKWSRVGIWRLMCHRDILNMDLEEDRKLEATEAVSNTNAASGPETATNDVMSERPSLSHRPSKSSSHKIQTSAQLLISPSTNSLPREDEEATPEVFQTPPTTAVPDDENPVPSCETIATASEHADHKRRPSVSSVTSSKAPPVISPPDVMSSPVSGHGQSPTDGDMGEDYGERHLLEQTGLLDRDQEGIPEGTDPSSVQHEGTPGRNKRTSASASDRERHDRSRLRRSLQRTLRESAGHLSHHRSRRGRESSLTGAASEDPGREDVLSRGAGSFTIHGKKASIISFGSELQNMSPEERLRQRKSSLTSEHVQSPTLTDDDFHSVLEEPSSPTQHDRRGSFNSASTATARSFRELRFKYSSAAGKSSVAASTVDSLNVPVGHLDEDSDAAVSLSDGRRSPFASLEDGLAEDSISFSAPAEDSKSTSLGNPEMEGESPDALESILESKNNQEDSGRVEEPETSSDEVKGLVSPLVQTLKA